MIVVKLKGGLGNQMFQYAALRALSLKYKKKAYLDLQLINNHQIETNTFTPRNFSLNIFKIKATPLSPLLKFFFKARHAISRNNYDDGINFNSIKFPACLDGYFQSENYFKKYRKEILKDFSLKYPLDEKNETILQEIVKQQAVSLHIRRGDYITKPKVFLFHGVCSIEYYKAAIEYIKKKTDSPVFYIFTDDPIWVQNNFMVSIFSNKIRLVNINQGADSWKDMYLMSKCKHNIIANSSFSWWGAWLNQNPDKIVIAPKQWFADPTMNSKTVDLIPSDWLRI